jgi:photosystem II stability/assembly factor-like uncharacterized protein
MMQKQLLTIVLCCAVPLIAADFWQRMDAPWGGQVDAMLVLDNHDVLVSLYELNVFQSMDDGNSWSPANSDMKGKMVKEMVQLQNGYIVAATMDSGLYVSKDHAATWKRSDNGLAGYLWFESLAVAPDQTLYAGSFNNGVYQSIDNGDHWQSIKSGLPAARIKHLAVTSNGIVFAATADNGIYRLKDSSEGWIAVNSGLENLDIFLLQATKNDTLYASTWAGGLYSSGNFGDSWKRVQKNQLYWTFRCFAQDAQGALYISGDNMGIYVLQPGQAEWQKMQDSPGDADIISLVCTRNESLLAGTNSSAVFCKEKGKDWVWSSKGLAFSLPLCMVYCRARDYFFVGLNGMGILRSKDDGVTWEKLANGLSLRHGQILAIDNKDYIYAAQNNYGIYRSTDFGDTWTAVTNGLTAWSINTLFANPVTGTLLAGMQYGQLFRSTDNGDNWAPSNTGLSNTGVNGFAKSADNQIYAATDDGLWVSSDDGKSWQSVTLPTGPVLIQCLALTSKNHIYLGTNGMGLMRSKDNGLTWEELNAAVPGSNIPGLAVDDQDRVYVAPSFMDFYRSDADGENWQNISSGIGKTDVAFLGFYKNHIYTGTWYNGLFRSVDPVTAVDPVQFMPVQQFQLQQNFPNPFNPSTTIPYYLAISGHVRLEILDLTGRHVRTLVSTHQPAGSYCVQWNCRDDAGQQVSSGIYVCRMQTANANLTRKMVVLR